MGRDREAFDPREYWETRLGAHNGLTGVGYAGLPDSFNRWMYRVRRRVFRRVVRQLDTDIGSARVLDVGSGTGFYVDLWQAAGAGEVEGMDISPTAVENLRACYTDLTFHCADIGSPAAAGGEAGRFDIISAMDVMFHLVDDRAFERAVANLHSLVRDGGWVIFSDNFLHLPERRLRHVVHRRLKHVERVLGGVGFEVEDRRPMFVLMNAPVDSRSRLLRLAWKAVSGLARQAEWVGWVTGALLYPVEVALTAVKAESPTTEMMICRKRGSTTDAIE